MSLISNKGIAFCNKKIESDLCNVSKLHAFPHTTSVNKYSKPFELIYANKRELWPLISNEGFRHYINFVESATHFNWVYQ